MPLRWNWLPGNCRTSPLSCSRVKAAETWLMARPQAPATFSMCIGEVVRTL